MVVHVIPLEWLRIDLEACRRGVRACGLFDEPVAVSYSVRLADL